MEEFVLQRLVREIYVDLQDIILKGGDFATLEDVLKKDLDELGRQLLQEVVSSVDTVLLNSENRKNEWIVKRKRKKQIKTIFGDVELERTYFQHKRLGRYAHLADIYLGIAKYQRLSQKLKYDVIENVCDLSYAKSVVNYGLTAETVRNILDEVDAEDLRKKPRIKEKKKTETIFVCADEDHVAIRGKGKKLQYLAYVYDEVTEANGRRKLENTYYFTRKQCDPEKFWLEVVDYIDHAYEIDYLKKIYLMGDGGAWIKTGLEWLPRSEFVLDKWHLLKYIRTACAEFSEVEGDKFGSEIWYCIKIDDRKLFNKTVRQMEAMKENQPGLDKVRKMKRYLNSNWGGIQNLMLLENHGCSAEGHISHILSARLSSRPMVWSQDGADKVAALRVFCKNGGNVRVLDLHSKRNDKKDIKTLSLDKGRRYRTYHGQVIPAVNQRSMPVLNYSQNEDVRWAISEAFRNRKWK